jgi:hypothetical protein
MTSQELTRINSVACNSQNVRFGKPPHTNIARHGSLRGKDPKNLESANLAGPDSFRQ